MQTGGRHILPETAGPFLPPEGFTTARDRPTGSPNPPTTFTRTPPPSKHTTTHTHAHARMRTHACMHAKADIQDRLAFGPRPPASSLHPSDRGHQALAELLCSLLIRAVEEEQAADNGCHGRPERWAEREAHPALRAIRRLPAPMIPGNAAAARPALCRAASDAAPNTRVSAAQLGPRHVAQRLCNRADCLLCCEVYLGALSWGRWSRTTHSLSGREPLVNPAASPTPQLPPLLPLQA